MNWISIISFTLCAGLLLSLLRKGTNALSPGRLFSIIWSLALGLEELKLSALQNVWSTFSWIIVLMGPAAFLLGVYAAFVYHLGTPLLSLEEIRLKLKAQTLNETRLFHVLVLVFCLYIGGYAILYMVKGAVPAFAANPARARMEFTLFAIGMATHNMPIILVLGLLYHLVARDQIRRKRIVKAFSVIALLSYVLLLQRYQIVMTGIMCLVILYYSTRRIRMSTVFASVAAMFGFFYGVSNIRAGKMVSGLLYLSSKMKFSAQYAIFTEPYMYIVMNLENLAYSSDRLERHSYGYFTFDYALALTGLKHWMAEYFQIADHPSLFSGYNTYTFFWVFYRDFGAPGLFLLSAATGWVCASLYYSVQADPRYETVVFYGMAVFIILLSFFLNPVGFLWFVYILLVLIIALRYVSMRHAQPVLARLGS